MIIYLVDSWTVMKLPWKPVWTNHSVRSSSCSWTRYGIN